MGKDGGLSSSSAFASVGHAVGSTENESAKFSSSFCSSSAQVAPRLNVSRVLRRSRGEHGVKMHVDVSGAASAGLPQDPDDLQRVIDELIRRKEEADRLKPKVQRKEPQPHGSGGKFAPLFRVRASDMLPALVPVLGKVESLTAKEFESIAPLSEVAAETVGQWSAAARECGASKHPLIALPYDDSIPALADPVAVLVPSEVFKVPLEPPQELLVVVDRAVDEDAFEPTKFYAWKLPGGDIHFGWFDSLPEASVASILGVVATVLFSTPQSQAKKNAFQELDDDFEF
eukprot:CAMPEP_0185846816 /NCGR_PEP_ID=MMETSP1354-20130828/2322_1 /TAXON_ID=708628 /ORGANISM="Erythrolobus madagascarensis, Strain CCMP3276" /LENGTH=286 /DNA_ID=CAMNT_0028547023 /DNA_START=115 /DNA_END=975 /DNA_ORIENTATION=-